MADERLTVTEYRALAEFRCQLRRLLRFSEDAARGAGLEPQHHQVLLALRGMPDGTAATPIVEVKNLNSFRAVERAIGKSLAPASHDQERRQRQPGIVRAAAHGCGRNTQIAAGSLAPARTPR